MKTFKICWIEGYGESDGTSETHVQSWFDDSNGFDEDNQSRLDDLDIGETLSMGGITDTVEITRIS